MAAPPDIEGLFRLPLAEFTAARNALAARLKAAGHDEEAASVKALPKPPLSAWAVNQLYWGHRKAFDRLITAGERLRKAQASQLAGKGGAMRAPLEARQAAVEDLTRRSADVLHEAGHAATPELTRRITTTLEALATHGSQPSAPPAGRLTGDVDSPGFDALAALVPRKGGRTRGTGPSRVIPFRQRTEPGQTKKLDAAGRKRRIEEARKARRSAAAAALRDAERALRGARKEAARAESTLRTAAAGAKVAEQRKVATEKRLEKAAAEADAARQAARRVASAAEEAAQAVSDAERTLDQARKALEELS